MNGLTFKRTQEYIQRMGAVIEMAGAAPQVFTVEQAATFNVVMLMAVEPKLKFGSQTEQETTNDGLGKWEAHLSAGFKAFGKTEYCMIKVGLVGEKNPGDGLAPGTPVELVGFQIGVMDKYVKDKESGQSKPVGAQVWYRADQLRSIAATAPATGGRKGQNASEAAA